MDQDINRTLHILSTKMVRWYEYGIGILPNFILAILIMVGFIYAGRLIRSLVGQVLRRTSDNATVNGLLQTLVYFFVLIFGMFAALTILNLDRAVTSLLAGAGVLGLVIGFAFQEIAANLFSGILIAFRKPYKVGDIVQVEDFFGTVQEITLRTTSILTAHGLLVLVPNKDMFTKALTNYTSQPDRRVDITVGVSYADDLKKVEQVTRDAVKDIPFMIKNKPVEFYYRSFGDSSINFQVSFWIEYPGTQSNYLNATHHAIVNIKEAFDKNGISIPYPIRTLDFGVRGGKTLNEVWPKN